MLNGVAKPMAAAGLLAALHGATMAYHPQHDLQGKDTPVLTQWGWVLGLTKRHAIGLEIANKRVDCFNQ